MSTFKKLASANKYTLEPYAKRMQRIDLDEMRILQRNISTPASPVLWSEVKKLYKNEIV
jgi:hypothetical protein